MGHPHLRRYAKEMSVEEIRSPETKQLIEDMVETMRAAEGIGLAAPQIDEDKQLAIVGIPEDSPRYPGSEQSDLMVVINPKITVLDPTLQGFWEGCLSVPGLRGYVQRPRKVKIDYLDQEGRTQTMVVENFLATVFQHELDHLFGRLYVDRIDDTTKLSFQEEFNQFTAEPSLDD